MVTIGMNYVLIPGKEEEFEKVFKKVLDIMEGMDGHGESHLYKDVWNSQSYLIVSQWTKKVAFDAFIASDQFRNVANWGKENILAGRPKHEVYGDDEPTGAPEGCPAHA
jgi:heme-degrading monooxygenase HmoA